MEVIEVLVEGGNVSPGPPLGPKLGPTGVNIQKVVEDINKATKDFENMQVPVTLEIDTETKDYNISVGTPPTTALVLQEAGVEKGSGEPNSDFTGEISIQDTVKISNMKKSEMLGAKLKTRVKEVVGTCVSMGIKVEGKDPRETMKLLEEGEFDDQFIE